MRRHERGMVDVLTHQPARLLPEFEKLSDSSLLEHFRERNNPSFLPGFQDPLSTTAAQRRLFPDETERLISSARRITREHRWSLLGFGEIDFGEQINWNLDPLSGRDWPLDFHADMALWHNDGSDIRVLWELNRLGHFLTLGRAYALTKEELFAEEFFKQLAAWREQNPVGYGANWTCAMEVALRAMNLLAAFTLFRCSPNLNEERLAMLLSALDQHGAHIRRNLEFSYVVTSNHYLSDITGLLWLGIMLPELRSAQEWRDWAIVELLREMDKQILPDGADYEASTGYHRFVTELFLYSFILCDANGISINDTYRKRLHTMLAYIRAILRPDGSSPLIGDTDGGQVLPIVSRRADDHAYLLALGAVIYQDSQLKLPRSPASEELLWTLGETGLGEYENMPVANQDLSSQAFSCSGTYLQRNEDLFLLFTAGGTGAAGRGSHGHNDALSVEVSACGRAFIVDPGAYVYTADLMERHLFRSTAYHSTVQIDDEEQNTIDQRAPFAIGNNAQPELLQWETGPERDCAVAEHSGYRRLGEPVRHRRKVVFEKTERWWLVEDEFLGSGEHKIATRFHFDAGLEVEVFGENIAVAVDKMGGARLFICPIELRQNPQLEPQFSSKNYGSKVPSVSASWTVKTGVPCRLRWAIIPVCAGGNELERLDMLRRQKKHRFFEETHIRRV
jgi:hypothetical protein